MNLGKAMTAFRAGDLDRARALCEARLAEAGADAAARELLARVEAAAGRPARALALLESVDLEKRPRASVLRARLLAEAGRREEALGACRLGAGLAGLGARDLNRLGELAGNLGDLVLAEACFRRVLAVQPDHVPACYNLGLVQLGRGQLGAARDQFAIATRKAPDLAEAWLQLGGACNALGRYPEAVEAFRRHLALNQASAPGWTWLGAAFQYLGDPQEAEAAYRRAIQVAPGFPDAHANLGRLLHASGRPEEAEDAIKRALALDPGHVVARAGLAARRERTGAVGEALALLQGEAPETRLHRARLLRRLGRHGAALAELDAVQEDPGAPSDARRQARFSIAQTLHEAGHWDEASKALREANAARLEDWRRAGCDPEADLDRLEAAAGDLERIFPPGAVLPRSRLDGSGLTLIVGLPRSGKSLLEQALAAHPNVAAAGELTVLGEIVSELPGWPDGDAWRAPAVLTRFGQRYLDQIRIIRRNARVVLDTMPFNFLNLGLAACLLPGIRVVAMARNPGDLALRCLLKNFAGRRLAFTTSPDMLARFMARYERIMTHWRSCPPVPMLEVRYEDLVHTPEAVLRRVLGFLALQWQPSVLDFHRTGRSETGDRPAQDPLHAGEIGAWRHYRDLLNPLWTHLPAPARTPDNGP